MVHLVFYVKLVLLRFFFVKLRCFYRVYKLEILVFSYPLLALKTRSSTPPTVRAKILPPNLYLVVFYQVSLVNQTRITCLEFRRPSVLFLGNFVVLYHMFIPPWGSCNKCSSMIVSIKDSVS